MNIDGIKVRPIMRQRIKPVIKNLDGLSRQPARRRVVIISSKHLALPTLADRLRGYLRLSIRQTAGRLAFRRHLLPWALTITLLFFGFGLGAFFVTQISSSAAQSQMPPVAAVLPRGSELLVSETPLPMAQLPDNKFYQMTLNQLEDYLDSISPAKLSQAQAAQLLAERKIKLRAFLQARQSPFVDIVDTLAELPHWQIILAVSNSESSLGKHCYTKNCSGIGVAPGNPLWREYESLADWAKDLNNLIEKRYKDWTLEQMNGVYNQPGSPNWVLAAKQVLAGLQQDGIQ